MPEEVCAERARLARIVVQAVSEVYAQKEHHQAALNRGEVPQTTRNALQAARKALDSAQRAYRDHIEKHRCRG